MFALHCEPDMVAFMIMLLGESEGRENKRISPARSQECVGVQSSGLRSRTEHVTDQPGRKNRWNESEFL